MIAAGGCLMSYLESAINIAREAGSNLKNAITKDFKVDVKDSNFDLVTEWDQKIENLITDRIKEVYPDHLIIGEESIFTSSKEVFTEVINENEHVWVIDPIDGTNNFIHRLPGYTVSIAKFNYGQIEIGVVYSPDNDEMFWAEKGKGAYLNNERLTVSNQNQLENSMFATGFPSEVANFRASNLDQINKIALKCRDVRIYGSAALHCAYVAAGRLEAFWEQGLHIWDIAAGWILAEEAGGQVDYYSYESNLMQYKSFYCGNKEINKQLIDVIE